MPANMTAAPAANPAITPVLTPDESSPVERGWVVDSATLVIGVTMTCEGLAVETAGVTRVAAGVGDCAAPGALPMTVNKTAPSTAITPNSAATSDIRINSRNPPEFTPRVDAHGTTARQVCQSGF